MEQASAPEEPTLGYEQIMAPDFSVVGKVHEGLGRCELRLQTFRDVDGRGVRWVSDQREDWPRIAIFERDRVLVYPIFTNPHAKRYRRPRHGRFHPVIYVDNAGADIPASVDDAISQLERRLPFRLFDTTGPVPGLTREVEEVWRTLSQLSRGTTLAVCADGETRLNGNDILINEKDLEAVRKALNRIDRRKRDGIQRAKHHVVFQDLLTKIEPEKFGRSTTEMVPLHFPARPRAPRTDVPTLEAKTRVVQELRSALPALASESPSMLIQLRTDIERATLAEMIAKFEDTGEESSRGKVAAVL